MTYNDSVSFVHSLLKFGIRPGLSRMNTLMSYLDNPEAGMPFVHIAGTNGKGSTATALACILSDAGYKTGLYTSPYVVHFLERIQINSKPISENLFVKAITEIVPFLEKMRENGDEITEFEIITAAAFLCFKRENCDIVVLETGLGGRLDATNVIRESLIEIITSLSLEHTDILGDTIEKIAYEKSGIIKEGTTVICAYGQQEAAVSVIKKTAEQRNCKLIIPDSRGIQIIKSDIFGTDFVFENSKFTINMAGEHQVKNMTCAIKAAQILNKKGFIISEKNIQNGISKAFLPARIEVLSRSPLVILDGGHNPDGIGVLVKLLKDSVRFDKLTVIIGMMSDKAVDECLKKLGDIADRFICVTPENPRALKACRLAEFAAKHCFDVTCKEKISDAYPEVISTLKQNDVLLITGSLYLAGEVKQISS
ncbi:MAG: Folylpolyglutamate synthase [Firmicutes bacterium ADurb.Bin300]|jgi:dihydrofolate synthase/folylpolyglutamate synthase|nr:MAG: Folylpolyglutamate synthase [Firmicutes bacterium ADurb.Bin300]